MLTVLKSEKVNFLSHFAGMLVWGPLTLWLFLASGGRWDLWLVGLIYGASVFFLFFCSAAYHKNKREENEKSFLRKMDHFAIFVMIAGSYTPVVYVWFVDPWRWITIGLQWSLTFAGLFFALFVRRAPRWIDPVLYLAMGWVALWVVKPLFEVMPGPVFWDMIAGGLLYTIGALIYGFRFPNFWPGRFGFHELFHFFILGGAAFHFSMILRTIHHASGF